jgi:hypothetical protein
VPDRKVIIGANQSKEEETKLIETLTKNKDIFAWSASNLKGVRRDIIQHALDINPKMRPKKQRQRKISEDRILEAKAKVQRLLDANVIREVKYLEWIANEVLVPKKNGKMRMCIYFTDLNKACKKDPFPLPRIGASIDKTTGCKSSHSWIVSQAITRFGLRKKTKKKQASPLLLEPIVTQECWRG